MSSDVKNFYLFCDLHSDYMSCKESFVPWVRWEYVWGIVNADIRTEVAEKWINIFANLQVKNFLLSKRKEHKRQQTDNGVTFVSDYIFESIR